MEKTFEFITNVQIKAVDNVDEAGLLEHDRN